MKCPSCGAAELEHDLRDLPYTFHNKSTVIHSVVGAWGPACGEVVVDAEESSRMSAAMLQFNKVTRAQ